VAFLRRHVVDFAQEIVAHSVLAGKKTAPIGWARRQDDILAHHTNEHFLPSVRKSNVNRIGHRLHAIVLSDSYGSRFRRFIGICHLAKYMACTICANFAEPSPPNSRHRRYGNVEVNTRQS
jgi:hypothetical protein